MREKFFPRVPHPAPKLAPTHKTPRGQSEVSANGVWCAAVMLPDRLVLPGAGGRTPGKPFIYPCSTNRMVTYGKRGYMFFTGGRHLLTIYLSYLSYYPTFLSTEKAQPPRLSSVRLEINKGFSPIPSCTFSFCPQKTGIPGYLGFSPPFCSTLVFKIISQVPSPLDTPHGYSPEK